MELQSFRNANLRGQSFNGQELKQKDFSNADLREVNFSNANLEGSNFRAANLTQAKFHHANLEGSNFRGANLAQAEFHHANLISVQAGLQIHWKIIYLFISFLLVFLAGVASAILANIVGDAISQTPTSPNFEDYLYLLLLSLSLVIFSVVTIFRGIILSILTIVIITISIIVLAFFKEILIPGKQTDITFLAIIIPLFMGIFLVIIGIESFAFNLMKVVSQKKNRNKIIFIAMFMILAVTIIVLHSPIFSATSPNEINAVAPKNFIAVYCVAIYQVLIICFIGWKSIAKENNKEWFWAYNFAIAIAAKKGTKFYGANLTEANLTKASLKNTDFRGAILTRTYWLGVQGIEHAHIDITSYLHKLQIQQLVIKGDLCKEKDFRKQDLHEINLQNFDLQEFDFSEADLRHSNLQEVNLCQVKLVRAKLDQANLSRADLRKADLTDADLRHSNLQEVKLSKAKLIRTKLDYANLSNAYITGAYIQDWIITKTTQLNGVECEYIYLRNPTDNDDDVNRMPPLKDGNFKGNDFHNFINSILDTLKFYHDQDINANVAIAVLKAMTKKYPEVKLEIETVGNSGDHNKSLTLKIIDGEVNRDEFEREYHFMYEQTLNVYDPGEKMANNTYNGSIVNNGQVQGGINMNNDHTNHSRTLNISGGTINNSGAGAFGLGDISGTVANTINQLPDSSETDQSSIKKLLTQLKEAIETESTLSDEDKADALSQLEKLALAGKNPNEGETQKTAKGAIRMLKGLAAELPTATKLVEGMSKLLPVIASLLGI